MRVIRKAVFETNSSSAHTISFTSFDMNKLNLNIKDKTLYIDLFDTIFVFYYVMEDEKVLKRKLPWLKSA